MCLKNILEFILKKNEININNKHELEILKKQQDFQRENELILKRQKENENINEYINVVKSIINGNYEYVRFNKVANIILSYFNDRDLCSKIRLLNKTIDNYFKQYNNLTTYDSVYFNDSIQTQFATIEEKLLDYIQYQNDFQDTVTKSVAQGGLKNEISVSANHRTAYLQKMKNLKTDKKPPRK